MLGSLNLLLRVLLEKDTPLCLSHSLYNLHLTAPTHVLNSWDPLHPSFR